MRYTKENVLEYVKEEDVKFIRLVFVDIKGVQKNISIMPNELEKAFEKGIEVSSTHIDGYDAYKKIILHPDPDTISLLPWRPTQGRVIRMFCDLTTPDGKTVESSSREVLKKAILENKSTEIKLRSEFEFYLFRMDDEGNNTGIPYDHAGYMDIAPEDKGENVRREICLSLSEMEIKTCGSHHDYGPGQNRIAVSEEEPLKAAENAITFESVVKTISARNGLYADFTHMPSEGLHVSRHKIIFTGDKNKMKEYKENLKKHYDEIYLFLNNTRYLYNDYDEDNDVTYDEFYSSVTIRRVSYTSNPYLAYALILYAVNDSETTNTEKADTLEKAKMIASSSSFIRKHVPEELLKQYLK